MADLLRVPPPRSEAELLDRADAVAGRTLGDVASQFGLPVPATIRRGKGWTGTVIEHALGASAGSLPEPDFRLISVELKTIPVGANHRPLESTYVCTVPLAGDAAPGWRDSNVRRKLARVLWMPFEGDRAIPLSERRIGSALLWSPSPGEDHALASDWETLMDRVVLGRVDEISPRDRGERRLGVDPAARVLSEGELHRGDPRAALRLSDHQDHQRDEGGDEEDRHECRLPVARVGLRRLLRRPLRPRPEEEQDREHQHPGEDCFPKIHARPRPPDVQRRQASV